MARLAELRLMLAAVAATKAALVALRQETGGESEKRAFLSRDHDIRIVHRRGGGRRAKT
jgi:hypothetical protein